MEPGIMRKKKKRKKGFKRLLFVVVFFAALAAIAVALFNLYYPLRHTGVIYECAATYDLKPELICAVIHAESRFDDTAVSPKGASGLMQITEGTAYWLAPMMKLVGFQYSQIFDPQINLRMGCHYLKYLTERYGDINVALCAYNAGSGTVDGWLNNPAYSDDGKTLKYIPFQETKEYVRRITERQIIYAWRLKL